MNGIHPHAFYILGPDFMSYYGTFVCYSGDSYFVLLGRN